MTSGRLAELKLVLDRLVRIPAPENKPGPGERPVFDEAISNFLRGGPALLDEATQYLWAYYRRVASEFDLMNATDAIPVIEPNSDIWEHVVFPPSPPEIRLGGTRLEPGRSYISFEGEVSWEPEHGLQLVFEHGRQVCKVGPYDGHNTNAHAFDDESLIDIIFNG